MPCSGIWLAEFDGFRMWFDGDKFGLNTPLRKIAIDPNKVVARLKSLGIDDLSGEVVQAAILELYLDKREWKILDGSRRIERKARLGQTFKQYLEDLQPLEPMTQEHKRYARQHWKEDQAALRKEFA